MLTTQRPRQPDKQNAAPTAADRGEKAAERRHDARPVGARDASASDVMAPARRLERQSILDKPALLKYLRDGLPASKADLAPKHCRAILSAAIDAAESERDAVALAHRKTEVPKFAVEGVNDAFALMTTTVAECHTSKDGSTTKMVVELQDGHRVEAVVMRHAIHEGGRERNTLCVSSQVGCKMGCTFCATGTLGELGNLTCGEILVQLVHAQRLFRGDGDGDGGDGDGGGASRRVSGRRRGGGITNLVFMGMGEPLNNYDAVIAALGPITDPKLFALAPSRVTVSTVGVVPRMKTLTRDAPGVALALSLHAPNQALRESIVPTARAYKLPALMEAMDEYLASGPKVKTMVEYCVLRGVNDGVEHARELGELLRGRDVIVNFIPYNPTDVPMGHAPPTKEAVKAMVDVLTGPEFGQFTTVRHEMGQDIAGACGQLALKNGPDGGGAAAAGGGDIEDLGKPGGCAAGGGKGASATTLRSRAKGAAKRVDAAAAAETESVSGDVATTTTTTTTRPRFDAAEKFFLAAAAASLLSLLASLLWMASRRMST